jgi:integrase
VQRPSSASDREAGKPRLLEQVRQACRARQFSPNTAQAYVGWVRRYVVFHGPAAPCRARCEDDLVAFLTHLATDRRRKQLHAEPGRQRADVPVPRGAGLPMTPPEGVMRPGRHRRVPVVLTRQEATAVLMELTGTKRLVTALLYGSGLRLMEALQLRVKDVDTRRNELTVRDGKGGRDRLTMLPAALTAELRRQVARVRRTHEQRRRVRRRLRRPAHGAAAQDPRRQPPAAMAVAVPSGPAPRGQGNRRTTPPPPPRDRRPARRHRSRTTRGHHEASDVPHVPSLVRHAPAGGRLRHPHRAGTPRPPQRPHDHDLHPRAEPGRPRRPQPAGRAPVPHLTRSDRRASPGHSMLTPFATLAPSVLAAKFGGQGQLALVQVSPCVHPYRTGGRGRVAAAFAAVGAGVGKGHWQHRRRYGRRPPSLTPRLQTVADAAAPGDAGRTCEDAAGRGPGQPVSPNAAGLGSRLFHREERSARRATAKSIERRADLSSRCPAISNGAIASGADSVALRDELHSGPGCAVGWGRVRGGGGGGVDLRRVSARGRSFGAPRSRRTAAAGATQGARQGATKLRP